MSPTAPEFKLDPRSYPTESRRLRNKIKLLDRERCRTDAAGTLVTALPPETWDPLWAER